MCPSVNTGVPQGQMEAHVKTLWEWIKEGIGMGLMFSIAFLVVIGVLAGLGAILPATAVTAAAAAA